MAREVNIILGINNNKACESIVKSIQTSEFSGLFPPECKLGRIATTNSRSELDSCIAGGEYNVAIVLEVMDGDKVGQGAIKAWRKSNPDCRIILLMDNARKCSIKTDLLYKIDYFDGLFVDDINILNLAEICKEGRDKERAYAYYGLEAFALVDKNAKPDINESVKEEPATVESVKEELKAELPVSPADTIEETAVSEDTLTDNTEDVTEVESDALSDAQTDVISEDEPAPVVTEPTPNNSETTQDQYEATAEFDGSVEGDSEPLDPAFFEERASFSTTSNTTKGKIKDPVVYKAKSSGKRRPLETIIKSDSSINDYIAKKEKEVAARKKRGTKEPTFLDILFSTAYKDFSAQYMVAFDDVALGKMSLEDFETKLFPYINALPAVGGDKQMVLNEFDSFVAGYDVLEPLLNEPAITEIHVLDAFRVRVKKEGQRLDTDVFFYGEGRYERFVEQLLLRNKKNFTAVGTTKVYTDSTYSDDYYIQVSITDKEVSTNNSAEISMRKTLKNKLLLHDLLEQGRITPIRLATVLHSIGSDKGIIVCGPPGSGKTTFMNAMLEHIPDVKNGIVLQYRDELIAGSHPELTIQHPVVETDGVSGVDMEALAKDALLLDVDYIVFGDIKGSEAKQFYTASTSGYTVWACVTAMSCVDAVEKISMYTAEPNKTRNILVDKIGLVVYVENWNVNQVLIVEGIGEDGAIKTREV